MMIQRELSSLQKYNINNEIFTSQTVKNLLIPNHRILKGINKRISLANIDY